ENWGPLTFWSTGRKTNARGGKDKGHVSELRRFVDACRSGAWPIPWEQLYAVSEASFLAVQILREGLPQICGVQTGSSCSSCDKRMGGSAGVCHGRPPDKPVDRALLEQMTRKMAHRGPDGEGFHIDGPLGFGHRRLAIIDLSETGSQPMCNEDRSIWINYNGEFYNHSEQRARLASKHRFRGTSDTETFLRLFEERGVECLGEIAGIFAVAFWDARRRVLTLARDPLGVKQLYYHDDGYRIVFASEIKALLCTDDVPREIDEEGVNQYIHFQT